MMLRKRSAIETLNDELKNFRQVEPSRRHSFVGFIVNLINRISSIQFLLKKNIH
ncbi:hypothetical protein ACFSSE_06515 [Pedobacter alpinus]|uniref:Transposase DDE domain-containing protein n=1 Tax=Pedobacter alpinus TaxID=1590643 RepID=A0ABW5TQP7_9SPHI